MKTYYIVYDEGEDTILYTGEDKEEALSSVRNHILDGYGGLEDIHLCQVEKEIALVITDVDVKEE